MQTYYLAIDIGASSGRHILGSIQNGRMQTEEIYRFYNGMEQKNGELCWDVKRLFQEILTGLKRCKEIGKIPVSMGIDTWAVDFVLLDKEDKIIGNAAGYRDERTKGMDQKVYKDIPEEELYERTGIQKQIFNTIYQLRAVKEKQPEQLQNACSMLLIPDYFHYLLTGKKAAEYTNATTTQLVSPVTKDWDWELIDRLGYPKKLFQKIQKPGTLLGRVTEEIQKEIGFDCEVILPATHDTGSAVLAVPSREERTMYISSGTWSLMGVERKEADCSKESEKRNFTNEGGYDYRFRYLKNIMGLWMIQCLKKELKEERGMDYSFAQLCDMAEKTTIDSMVDCNSQEFLSPKSMIDAVKGTCLKSGQRVPETPGELARVIYRSLAECYHKTAKELESSMGISYEKLYVVGGGSHAEYLNKLTARSTGKAVLAGPGEATAIGNLMVQMLKKNQWKDLKEARKCVYNSFAIKVYCP